jgi:hypothetical protein
MKKQALVLLALFVLTPSAQLLAQEPAQQPAQAQGTAAQAPDLGQLLDSPSCEQPEAPGDPAPAPSFMTGCMTNADCPTGQLCCNLCGAFPDDGSSCLGCVQPVRKRCPLVV